MFLRNLIFISSTLSASFSSFAEQAPSRKQFDLVHTEQQITVDGILDEDVWASATKMELLYDITHEETRPASVKTEMFIYEDGKSLNIAIKAYDPNPELIRASLRDRDQIWLDDNVGIIIDTFNDERSGFEFFANPLGAQADQTMTDTNGWNEDSSWDAIWSSAGKVTDEGYIVEMSIPFSSLRFPDSDGELIWNISGWRNYPRDIKSRLATYKRDRNIKCSLCQFVQLKGFKNVKAGRNLQITPTITASRVDEKEVALGDWTEGGVEVDPGLDIRWGVTQDMVLNATLNPDFSQVEADSGQLDINTTNALYYREKRPFFLDGSTYFKTSRLNLVHTRNIADPDYGVKLTGKTSDHSYGLIVADDKNTSFLMPGKSSSDVATLEQESKIAIARYKVDVGERSDIGVLMTNRSSDDYKNTVLSVDGNYGLSDVDSIRYQVAKSETKNPEAIQDEYEDDNGNAIAENQNGEAYSLAFNRRTKDYHLVASYDNRGADFRADMGFVTKVNFERVVLGGGQKWYGKPEDVINQWGYSTDWDKTFDQGGNMIEEEFEIFGWVEGAKQSFSEVGLVQRERLYDGQYFDEQQAMMFAKFTPFAGFQVRAFTKAGKQIDYDNTRLGDVFILEPEISWDINEHLHLNLSHEYSHLDVDDNRLYSANLTDLRLGYQFDMRSMLKLVVQYTKVKRNLAMYLDKSDLPDEVSRGFSTQLIYSYKINPQTLFFVGYSDGGDQENDFNKLERNQRAVFTKFSYAWQM
jgi:hypothetical protein